MLRPKTKRYILQIIPFGVIWFIFSIIYGFLEKGILGNLDYYPSTGNPYDFTGNFFITVVTSTISGLVIGAIEIIFLNKLFVKQSFSKKIVFKTLIYFVLMVTFLLVNTVLSNANELQTSIFDPKVWDNVRQFLSSFAFWSVELYVAALIIVSLFYTEVSDNVGQGVLNNFFTGKYHNPVEEERIFMFLDMKSSTTIAEKIGHVKYFELLKEYYADLTDPIIQHAGEIYQYVGDEIVVSWDIKTGLHNNNCLNCFFAMKTALKEQSEKYREYFGLVPGFKAGFHEGMVTAGEIGVIKKDIIFTGDVLNTTARIQGLCNSYKVEILISKNLMQKLTLDTKFQAKELGVSQLKGRDEKIALFTVLEKK